MTEAILVGLALMALRIGLGVELVIHGWPKLRNPGGIAGFFGQMGLKPALFWTWVVILVEFAGGLALILGLMTRAVALLTAIEFLVIVLYIKPAKMKVGFTTPQGQAGWEWDWLLFWMSVALLLAGAGAFGLDRALKLPI